jgi:hypothetical protein
MPRWRTWHWKRSIRVTLAPASEPEQLRILSKLVIDNSGPHGMNRYLMRKAILFLICLVWALVLFLCWRQTDSVETFTFNLFLTYLSVWLFAGIFSQIPTREKLLTFILVNGSIAFTLLVIEVPTILGLLDYRVVLHTPLSPSHDPANIADTDLIFRRQLNSHKQGSFRGGDINWGWDVPDARLYTYDIHYDRNGFRNTLYPSHADIVVLGDSFVEGTNVSDEELMTSLIAKNADMTVLNLGLSTYGPQQELIAFQRYGLPVDPKAVISVFFEGNDLNDVTTYLRMRDEPRSNRHSLIDRLFTKNAVSALYRLAGRPRQSALPRSALIDGAGIANQRTYFMYGGEPISAKDEAALDVARDTLAQLHAICQTRGIPLILAFAPTSFRVYKDFIRDPGTETAKWIVNDLPARLEQIAKNISNDIIFVDLTPGLVESTRHGQLPYFNDDSHWSPTGNRIAGSILSQTLLEIH